MTIGVVKEIARYATAYYNSLFAEKLFFRVQKDTKLNIFVPKYQTLG